MTWFFRCPLCGVWMKVGWEQRRTKQLICKPHGEAAIDIPGPAEQPEAFVDSDDWPVEMEQAVYARHGRKCAVPSCTRPAETLRHCAPFVHGGPTSVANLHPMCRDHSQMKGDAPYHAWLLSLGCTPHTLPVRDDRIPVAPSPLHTLLGAVHAQEHVISCR